MTTTRDRYYCIVSDRSSRSPSGPGRIAACEHSLSAILGFADAARPDLTIETLDEALDALTSDGEIFLAFPDTKAGREVFLAAAAEYGVADAAHDIVV